MAEDFCQHENVLYKLMLPLKQYIFCFTSQHPSSHFDAPNVKLWFLHNVAAIFKEAVKSLKGVVDWYQQQENQYLTLSKKFLG